MKTEWTRKIELDVKCERVRENGVRSEKSNESTTSHLYIYTHLKGTYIKSFNNIWLTKGATILSYFVYCFNVYMLFTSCVRYIVSTVAHSQTNTHSHKHQLKVNCILLLAQPVVWGYRIYWWKLLFLVPLSLSLSFSVWMCPEREC